MNTILAEAASLKDMVDYGIAYAVMGACIIWLTKLVADQRSEIKELNKSYSDDYIKLLVQDIEIINKNSFTIENAPANIKHQIHEELDIFKKEIEDLLKQKTI